MMKQSCPTGGIHDKDVWVYLRHSLLFSFSAVFQQQFRNVVISLSSGDLVRCQTIPSPGGHVRSVVKQKPHNLEISAVRRQK